MAIDKALLRNYHVITTSRIKLPNSYQQAYVVIVQVFYKTHQLTYRLTFQGIIKRSVILVVAVGRSVG